MPGSVNRRTITNSLGGASSSVASPFIVRERRNISADVALRLAAALGTTAQFWLNIQASYDLRKAEIEKGDEIAREVHLLKCCA
jgi:addiction module HigA family antidote